MRERRNERMVVSRRTEQSDDIGETWDIENSVDIWDGTPEVGGDRSYPASIQIDDQIIGTVLYETREPPQGGHIWFVTTPISTLNGTQTPTLCQSDPGCDAAFALWPKAARNASVEVTYHFTGRFGQTPNIVGLLMGYRDEENYSAFEFQMGAAPDRSSVPINHVQMVTCQAGQLKVTHAQAAVGGWFDDGNIHHLGARHTGSEWIFTIDGHDQFAVADTVGDPCGGIVRRAAVALYDLALTR